MPFLTDANEQARPSCDRTRCHRPAGLGRRLLFFHEVQRLFDLFRCVHHQIHHVFHAGPFVTEGGGSDAVPQKSSTLYMSRRFHRKTRQERLQVQSHMALRGRLAPTVLYPVHAVSHKLDGRGVHHGENERPCLSTPCLRANFGTKCAGISSTTCFRTVIVLLVGFMGVSF